MAKQTGSGDGDQINHLKFAAKHPKVPVSKINNRVVKEKETTVADCMEASTETRTPPTLSKRKRTSLSWNEFEQILENGKVTLAKCKHCDTKLGAKSTNGTSSLNKHLKSCDVFKKTQKQINQMYLKASEKGDGSVAAYNFKFNQEVTRDCIARMIILHELPFSFVEYIGFRRLLTSLQPHIKLVKRNTTKSDCMKVYEVEKKHLYETFSEVQSRISLTTDMWTCTTQNKGYMALTAHYIDKEWRVQKKILSFSLVEEQHTGVNMAKVLMGKLYAWNIDSKLASITLDNAAANKVMVAEIVDQLKPGGLLLGGELFHIRCSAHVIAVIVDYGMKHLKDEIEKVRNSVKYIRSSPQRQGKFEEVCLQVNAPKNKLIQDVDTRWNSTYLMLQTALQFKEAFIRYAKIETDFLRVAPTDEDWKNASALSNCLKVFYEVTVLFSGTKYVTINRFFDIACMLYMDIRDWRCSEDRLISKMAENMWERFEKYWDITSKTFAIASILDPRFKLKSMAYYFPKIYHHDNEKMQLEVRNILNRLYNEYVTQYASSTHVFSGNISSKGVIIGDSVSVGNRSGCGSSQSSFTDRLKGFTSFLEESSQNSVALTDLEQYLLDDSHPIQKGSGMNNLNDSSFDLLGWWKFHGPKYPIVAMMARDILAIPASSVASESVFSTSGRVIEKYRASMLPDTIEALICGQDWIRSGLENEGFVLEDTALQTLIDVFDEIQEQEGGGTNGDGGYCAADLS